MKYIPVLYIGRISLLISHSRQNKYKDSTEYGKNLEIACLEDFLIFI
jgi:hypothetical protein